ncbi:MAG: circadian clock protein KaiA [Pleurocapsa sp.]
MSERKDQHSNSTPSNLSGKLHICLFSTQSQFIQSVSRLLNGDCFQENTEMEQVKADSKDSSTTNGLGKAADSTPATGHSYKIECFSLSEELTDFITQNKEQIDCIVLINDSQLNQILRGLRDSRILLPVVIIETEESIKRFVVTKQDSNESAKNIVVEDVLYHRAEIQLYPTQLLEISSYINLAITKFLSLTPDSETNGNLDHNELDSAKQAENSLVLQQRRLTNKIKERLGYLGVYYKRDSNDFYRNLLLADKEKLIQKLSNSYRQILLNYFDDNSQINKLIDEFVDRAFFADVSTSQILEIHMDLIDDFSHQLQIEGRNDDILLDYRLPLIDVISHLCEMYRRSIPQEDISLELLFGVK